MRAAWLLAAVSLSAAAADWKPLFNGKDLSGWETRGDCIWRAADGVLIGQRSRQDHGNPFGDAWPVDRQRWNAWLYRQAWLYTEREFEEFDLSLEYWIPVGGNSGVSIRDRSRAHHAIGEPDAARPELAAFPKTTPAHIGYEIQIIDDNREKNPTGSIYSVVPAQAGAHRSGEWNRLEIESRADRIRVRVNGRTVAESPGDPKRSRTGPIGLQLHDQFTFAMFRNIRIREVSR